MKLFSVAPLKNRNCSLSANFFFLSPFKEHNLVSKHVPTHPPAATALLLSHMSVSWLKKKLLGSVKLKEMLRWQKTLVMKEHVAALAFSLSLKKNSCWNPTDEPEAQESLACRLIVREELVFISALLGLQSDPQSQHRHWLTYSVCVRDTFHWLDLPPSCQPVPLLKEGGHVSSFFSVPVDTIHYSHSVHLDNTLKVICKNTPLCYRLKPCVKLFQLSRAHRIASECPP